MLVLTLVVVCAPRVTPWRAAGIALGVSWAVEFFQLTGVPAGLAAHSTFARLVLGTSFDAPDLFWYAVGAAGAAACWALLRAERSGSRGRPSFRGARRTR